MKFRWDLAPLSVNRVYGLAKKTMFKSKQYLEYEKAILERLQGSEMEQQMLEGKLRVKYKFGFKRSNSDIDNPVKPLQDILQNHYGFNDKQIYELEVEKYLCRTIPPFVEFEIELLDEDHLVEL